jgi:hypothetical protein
MANSLKKEMSWIFDQHDLVANLETISLVVLLPMYVTWLASQSYARSDRYVHSPPCMASSLPLIELSITSWSSAHQLIDSNSHQPESFLLPAEIL